MEMRLKQNLKRLIDEHKILLTQLSISLKIPNSTLHGWMNGVPPKNINDIKKVSDYFGISLDELCFGPNSKIRHSEKVVVSIDNVELILRIKQKENV